METNEVSSKSTVMSTGLKFGLILGIVSIAINLLQTLIGRNPMEGGWIQNLINIVLTVTTIVFAHKSFKENGDGYMTYGQGFGISVITVLVSLIVGGLYTYLYLTVIDPSAFEAIFEKVASDMEAKGQSEDAIEMAVGMTRNFFWAFFIVGALFWGCILGLIVSIFTQKKAPEQF
jgi:hypothetical protein